MIAIVGPTPIDSATEYTLGAMYAHEMLLFCGLLAMVMSVFHVISHTRKEEDLGLTELVRSFHIGRQANSLATMVETILINVILALFISGVLMSFGAETITVEGSLIVWSFDRFCRNYRGWNGTIFCSNYANVDKCNWFNFRFNRLTIYHSCRNGYFQC